MVMKSLEYPLPACTLTETQCDAIMWKVRKVFLPKAGINRNLKKEVVYGPQAQQGLGLKNLYYTQGIKHLNDIIEHKWRGTITGHMINSALEQLRLEIGCNINLLQEDMSLYKHLVLTESWIATTWGFLSEYNINIELDIEKIPLSRRGDKVIMEEMLNAKIDETTLKKANRCRIYLNVFTLSDITTGDGRRIKQSSWAATREKPRNIANSASWTLWESISNEDRAAWKEALQRTFCPERERILQNPVQEWSTENTPKWTWFISPETEKLYSRTKGWWKEYSIKSRSRRNPTFFPNSKDIINKPKGNIFRTTVLVHQFSLEAEGWCGTEMTIENTTRNEGYKDWLQATVQQSKEIDILVEDIKRKKILAVSDGSYKEDIGKGTAAWRIESSCGTQFIQGTSIVPGPPEIQNAYRSELVGQLALLDKIAEIEQ